MEFNCFLSAKLACGLQRKSLKKKLPQDSIHEFNASLMEPKVVKEGWLRKRSECFKTWQDRYFVLREDGSLLGVRNRPRDGAHSDPSSSFSVKECQVMLKESRRHYAFILRLSRWDRTLRREFSVSSKGERTEWLQAMKLVDDISNRDFSVPEKAGTCERTRQHGRKITLDDFELIRTLGRGFFGKVLLARERSSDRPYAIKIISKESVATKGRAEQTMAERRTLQKTSHPFLITLKYSFQTRDRLCFVMEYAPGGELLFHLVKERYFNEEKTRFYGAEILLALEYLHEQGIIYRDLKLENLLLDRDGHIKITDFGLCKEGMTYGRTTNTFCGTPDYLAPEVLDGDGYGRAVDWWGLGIVLYEMMSGRFPFECKNQKLLYDRILNNEVRIPHSLSRYAKSLLRGLLTKDPEIRLGGGKRDAKDIKEHAFFRTVPWEELLAKEIAPPFKPQVASGTDSRYFDPEFTQQSVCLTPICFSRSSRKATPFFRDFSYCEDSE